MLEGPGHGVHFDSDAQTKVFHRYAPEFLDDPDEVALFTPELMAAAKYSLPPVFAASVSDALLVGYRSILLANGQFLSDEVALNPAMAKQRINRLSTCNDLGNEATGLRADGDDGRFRLQLLDRPVRRVSGAAVVLCSDEALSYGSFLFRVLPKVKTMRSLGLTHLPCVCYSLPENARTLLSVTGLKSENMIWHDLKGLTQIDRAIVPGLRNPDTFFDPGALEIFEELRAASDGLPRTRRLYVSRLSLNHAGWSTRIMRNEAELIARLERLGFECIEPELMNMQDQIAAFASAEIVVGPSGSGMFNTILCRPGTKIIDLQSEAQWIYSYTGMYSSLGLRYGIFVGKAERQNGATFHLPWTVNLEALLTRVQAFLAA